MTFFSINPAEHSLDFYELCIDTTYELAKEDFAKNVLNNANFSPAEVAVLANTQSLMTLQIEKLKELKLGMDTYTKFSSLCKAVSKFKDVTKEDTAVYNKYVKAQLALWQFCDSITPQQLIFMQQVIQDPKHKQLTSAHINMYKELSKTGVEEDDKQKIICEKYGKIIDAIEGKYACNTAEGSNAPTNG